MRIQKAERKDLPVVTTLACLLWPDHGIDEMQAELERIMEKHDAAFFLAYTEETAIGFAQCQLRYDYVEGSDSSPTGYLEGIYVAPEYRHRGIGKKLLSECEQWAKSLGCTDFASDSELGNAQSLQFHLKAGFEEANRIICFVKKL